jgi:hypothetical protein
MTTLFLNESADASLFDLLQAKEPTMLWIQNRQKADIIGNIYLTINVNKLSIKIVCWNGKKIKNYIYFYNSV